MFGRLTALLLAVALLAGCANSRTVRQIGLALYMLDVGLQIADVTTTNTPAAAPAPCADVADALYDDGYCDVALLDRAVACGVLSPAVRDGHARHRPRLFCPD